MDIKHNKTRHKCLADKEEYPIKIWRLSETRKLDRSEDGKRPPTKECSGKSEGRRKRVGLFHHAFSKKETGWDRTIHSKHEGIKSIYSATQISHDRQHHSKKGNPAGVLCNHNRPERCVHPHPNKSKGEKILQIHSAQQNVSVSHGPIWSNISPSPIHRNSKHNRTMGCDKGHSDAKLSRRPDHLSCNRVYTTDPQKHDDTEAAQSRMDHKCEEIPTNTFTTNHIHRHESKFCHPHGVSNLTKNRDFRETDTDIQKKVHIPTGHTKNARYHGVLGRLNAIRKTDEERFSICHKKCSTSQKSSSQEKEYQDHFSHEISNHLVEHQTQYTERDKNHKELPDDHHYHRCIDDRLWSSLRELDNTGELVPWRIHTTHQCARIRHYPHSTHSIPKPDPSQTCSDHIRQHNSSGIHKTSRGDTISDSHRHCQINMEFCCHESHKSEHLPYIFQSECPCRPFEQNKQTSTIRMDAKPSGVPTTLFQEFCTTDRFVRKQVESSNQNLCQPLPRHTSQTCERSDPGLEHLPKNLPLPTHSITKRSGQEIIKVQRQSHSHSPSSKNPAILSKADTFNACGPSTSTHKTPTITSRDRKRSVPSKSRDSKSTRVDYIRQAIKHRGFSNKVAQLAANPQRKSSVDRYNCIWKQFVKWYRKRGTRMPHKASRFAVADYLVHLKEQGKAYSTILSHKSAICTTIYSISGKDYATDHVIKKLLQACKNTITMVKKVPQWNFHIVLAALRKPPFEPIKNISSKHLTMKTLFLTAWASAARISEIHALSVNTGHFLIDKDSNHIDLVADVNFLAKNQVSDEPPRRFRIKAIKNYIEQDDPDQFLCPVRALLVYFNKTKMSRSSSGRLFQAIDKEKDMSIHAISYWLKQTILEAYRLTKPNELRELHKVSPHEIRAISTSFALYKHVPMKEILRNAYWKSQSTFTSFYLKNMPQYKQEIKSTDTIAAGFRLQL